MTYEQFWEQDCLLVIPYRKAYQIQHDQINYEAWLNGLYIWKALQSAPIFVNGFMPKGARVDPYFEKPLDFKTDKKRNKAKENEQKMQNAVDYMQGIASRFNRQFDEKRQNQRLKTNPPKEE